MYNLYRQPCSKISFVRSDGSGKSRGLTFQMTYSALLLLKTSRVSEMLKPQEIFSEPILLTKEIYLQSWTDKFTSYTYFFYPHHYKAANTTWVFICLLD